MSFDIAIFYTYVQFSVMLVLMLILMLFLSGFSFLKRIRQSKEKSSDIFLSVSSCL